MNDIKFLKPLIELPKINTNIYRFRAPKVNEIALMNAAKKFNLKGDRRNGGFSKDTDKLTYTEGPFVVNLFQRSGALRYFDSTRWQVDFGNNIDISDEEAVKIATKYIKEKNLVTIQDYKLLKVTRLYVGTAEQNSNKGETRIIDIGVVFQRMIDKVPVDGPGGKVKVFIDHNKQITCFENIGREMETILTKIPFSQLRTPKFAQEDLINNWQKRILGKSHIEVSEIRFGYFEDDRYENQLYLQPAYIMPLKQITLEGLLVMKSIHIVAAAPIPPVRIMPPLKRIVLQPVRN